MLEDEQAADDRLRATLTKLKARLKPDGALLDTTYPFERQDIVDLLETVSSVDVMLMCIQR